MELPHAVDSASEIVGSYWDEASQCHIIATTPAACPQLWRDYLNGAVANYREHGVERVVDYELIRDGVSTSLAFIAVNGKGRVVGGVRAQGPYTRAEQAHAMVEWDGELEQPLVQAMIEVRLPFGVVEAKTAWVADSHPKRRELAACLPRACVHAATLLGVRFALGTSAVHTLKLWRATGCVIEEKLTPVPYPDNRYKTTLVWWDRNTFAEHAEVEQLRQIRAEQTQLFSSAQRLALSAAQSVGAQ